MFDLVVENFVVEMVECICSEYKENIGKIEVIMDDGLKKEFVLLNEEKDLFIVIGKQIVKKEVEVVKDLGNVEFRNEIFQLKEVQVVQEVKVSEWEFEFIVIEKVKIDSECFCLDIMLDYCLFEILNCGNYSEEEINVFMQQEQKLQDLYVKKFCVNEKKLEKLFDLKLVVENKVIVILMEQFVNCVQQFYEFVIEDFVIRECFVVDFGDDLDMLMNSNLVIVDEVKCIIMELKEYEVD